MAQVGEKRSAEPTSQDHIEHAIHLLEEWCAWASEKAEEISSKRARVLEVQRQLKEEMGESVLGFSTDEENEKTRTKPSKEKKAHEAGSNEIFGISMRGEKVFQMTSLRDDAVVNVTIDSIGLKVSNIAR